MQSEVSECVRRAAGAETVVFPGIDEEAVEATEGCEEECGGEQSQSEVGAAGDGGDEGCCGEEEADGDLFGEAVGATRCVDEDEVGGDEGSEDQLEVDGCGFEAGKERCEGDGREDDSGEEGGAVKVVEVVAGFEVFVVRRVEVKMTGINQTGMQ